MLKRSGCCALSRNSKSKVEEAEAEVEKKGTMDILEKQALQKRAKQLRLLNELSTKLQGMLDTENFYQEIVELIQQKFHYYSLQFWRIKKDGSSTLEAQAGAYGCHLDIGYTLQPSEEGRTVGITGVVIKTKKSYLSNDTANDSNFTDLALPVHSKSELCIPIIKDNEVIATLNVESDKVDAFDEDDIITLEGVSAQITVALTNRNLFHETREFNAKLQSAVYEKTLELRQAHERILEQQSLLQKENKALKTLINKDHEAMEIVGKSPAIMNVLAMVDKIAPTTATVLIQGDSGTGKELIARRLHNNSERSNHPFVVVNCGALQETLLESELFGHEKGAFTGAIKQKIGLVETADGGTLFLDEIGELSPGIQAKLLRFIQNGEFYRIGGKRPLNVSVRLVSATNRVLEEEVKACRFREDLFYRINTITIRMPPLNKRREDIPALVEFFLKNSRFGGPTQQIKRIDPRVWEVFSNYSWPGNIRELQNTVERLKILAENNEIRLEDIPFNLKSNACADEPGDFSMDMPLEELEKKHILRSLVFHQGNKTKTAQNLGITIKTLYNKLHRYGMLQPDANLSKEA